MRTYFIRHGAGIDISNDTRNRLWRERRIAIHYPHDRAGHLRANDNASLDPEDYAGKAKSIMSIFRELAQEGGYVCAQYFGQSELLIGTVNPDSRIKLFHGEWGTTSRTAMLKSLVLSEVKVLNPRDHSIIAASRPRMGTLARWHAVGTAVAGLIEGRRQPLSWDLLSTAQQEVACSEFLRLPEASKLGLPTLQSLLLPVGRTLKDVDIVGITKDGKRLFAQVTCSRLNDITWKLDKLKQFVAQKKAYVLLFCKCDALSLQDGITIIPVQRVFSVLKNLDWGKEILRGIS